MKRNFVSVGQGVFNIEILDDDLTVVIDCGSENKSLIESKVNERIKEKQTIEYVFISHFHKDHMNGLEYLLRKAVINNIVIPYVDDESKLLLMVQSYLFSKDDFVDRCIKDFSDTMHKINSNVNIITIAPENRTIRTSGNIVLSKKPIKDSCLGHMYIPYYFHDTKKRKIFFSYLKAKGLTELKKFEDAEYVYENKDVILEAYNKCEHNLNDTSLMVYSNPIVNDSCKNKKEYPLNDCLYTGDINLKRRASQKDIRSFVDGCNNKIRIIELPHHGSKYNFSRYIISKSDFFIASAGLKNKYHHPHKAVIMAVEGAGKKFLQISDDAKSELCENS